MSNIQKVMDMKEYLVTGKTSEYSFPQYSPGIYGHI